MDTQQTLSAAAPDEEFWSIKIVMTKTGLSRAAIYDYVSHQRFPRQRRIGPNRVAWFATEVRAWMASRPQSGVGSAANAQR
jgi:predicted DNA-binding transcriptional regulator AlpA